MHVYTFGSKMGRVSARNRAKIERIVKRIRKQTRVYLAFTTYTDPGCSCGKGCARDCPANARSWFETLNQGFPFDQDMERYVAKGLKEAGIER